jgi:hypothetical protein
MATVNVAPYARAMRAARIGFWCVALSTCDPAAREPADSAAHPPFDPPPPVAEVAPPPSLSTGPFWQQVDGGQAVPILRADAPNMRYAALDRASCEAELARRHVPFAEGEPTIGVLAPVRLRGLLSGVSIHSSLAPAERERSRIEIFDCRLVLALDDFAAMVHERGVVEIIHLSAYRPRSQFGCTPKYDGKQHCGALAVDLATFKRADGSVLSVEKDFHGRVGLSTCTGARPNELWSIVCDAADRAIFNVILTPNFNAQHNNHIHVEVTPDAEWMLVH